MKLLPYVWVQQLETGRDLGVCKRVLGVMGGTCPSLWKVPKLGWAEAMEVESLTSGRMFLGSHRPLASVISAPIGTAFHSH